MEEEDPQRQQEQQQHPEPDRRQGEKEKLPSELNTRAHCPTTYKLICIRHYIDSPVRAGGPTLLPDLEKDRGEGGRERERERDGEF